VAIQTGFVSVSMGLALNNVRPSSDSGRPAMGEKPQIYPRRLRIRYDFRWPEAKIFRQKPTAAVLLQKSPRNKRLNRTRNRRSDCSLDFDGGERRRLEEKRIMVPILQSENGRSA
jgi:hypothetical protein